MKANVKVLGFVKCLIHNKIFPFVAELDGEVYWVISEDDEVIYKSKDYISEVIWF